MLDQALDAAERLRELEDLRARDEGDRFLLRFREEGDHPAEVAHLACRDRMARVRRQAGIQDSFDAGMARQHGGDHVRVDAVLSHADGERLHAAQHEPGVERPGHRAE